MREKAPVPTHLDWSYDENIARETGAVLCGVDEAGRGPLCGSVVAGACVLPDPAALSDADRAALSMLNDSKKLSEKKRELLYGVITRVAVAYGIGEATPAEIDERNILNASLLAMRRAVDMAIRSIPDTSLYLLIDGNRTCDFPFPSTAVVHGDALSPSIAAASILAKVTRDRACVDWDRQYPGFGIAVHKGYPTKAHREAVLERVRRGEELPELYRRSFLGFTRKET